MQSGLCPPARVLGARYLDCHRMRSEVRCRHHGRLLLESQRARSSGRVLSARGAEMEPPHFQYRSCLQPVRTSGHAPCWLWTVTLCLLASAHFEPFPYVKGQCAQAAASFRTGSIAWENLPWPKRRDL
ncbi:hypothetical protein NDU88_005502 [Pleurodeles waltl]|uniref:Uncharacterized protein n=1 Tax=Pleurodeles waltl TaxID=8319 RepID=A0AAV7WAL8_PLEWA|nr:hypothetical protein NDU88_005502 [Pleurodeles waltl]